MIVSGLLARPAVVVTSGSQFTDDAWIFFRYARSFATGDGLVYNAGEHVYGFTSPLYTIALAAVAKVAGPAALEPVAFAIGVLCWIGLGWVVSSLAVRTMPVPWLAGVVVALWFSGALSALNGMETGLFMLLLFLTALLFVQGRLDLAVIVAALAALSRPEGYVLLALAGLLLLLQHRRQLPWRGIGVASALLIGWSAIAVAVYGSIVPQSLLAKAGAPESLGLTTALRTMTTLTLGLSSSQLKQFGGTVTAAAVLASILVVALVVVDALNLWRRRSPEFVLPAWFLLITAGYVVARPVSIWSWYTAPTAVVAMWSASRQVGIAYRSVSARRAAPRCVGVLGATVVVTILVGALAFTAGRRSANLSSVIGHLDEAADVVRDHVADPESVMLGDIGVVGWELADAEIYDLSGLVTPEAAEDDDGLASLGELVRTERPEAIILTEQPLGRIVTDTGSLERPTFDSSDSDWFQDNYVLVARPAVDETRGRWVYVRSDHF